MSYIGRGIDQIDNISTLDNLSFNGSSTTFNLTQNSVAFVPVSADALQIQIDGVIQSGNYTVSGSTVTFDFTPSGSSVCNGIRHYGVGIITSVSDGAVTNTKLGADSVNGSKIADDSISDEHLDITAITGQTAITSLADTDKFLVSDASDSGNLKYVEKQYLPSGGLTLVDSGTGSSVTNINIDNVFTTAYKAYKFVGGFRPATNSEDVWFLFRSGGSNAGGSEYRYVITAAIAESGANSDARQSSWGQTYWKCSTNSQSNSSNFMQYIDMNIMNPMASSTTFGADDAHAFGTSLVYSGSSQVVASQFGVNYQTNGNYDGLHITFSSGNINAYNYQIYGYNPS